MQCTNEIFNRFTNAALEKLAGLHFYDMKTFFSVAKLKAEYDNKRKPFDLAEAAIARRLCDKDDQGNPVRAGMATFTFTKNRDQFEEEHNALIEQKIELKVERPIIKAKVESDLFGRTFICEKCKKEHAKDEKDYLTAGDVAAIQELVEFIE